MGYLARREYSAAELSQRLGRKGFPEQLVNEVLAEFRNRGWQSDVRFAEVFSRDRLGRGCGPYRITQELRQRGVVSERADELDSVDWDRQIDAIHARKYGCSLPETLAERAARERFLIRKGYSGDQIRRLFRRLRDGECGEHY